MAARHLDMNSRVRTLYGVGHVYLILSPNEIKVRYEEHGANVFRVHPTHDLTIV